MIIDRGCEFFSLSIYNYTSHWVKYYHRPKKNTFSNDTILKDYSAPNKQNQINICFLPK